MKKHEIALMGLRDIVAVKRRFARARQPIDRIELNEEIKNIEDSIRILKADAARK